MIAPINARSLVSLLAFFVQLAAAHPRINAAAFTSKEQTGERHDDELVLVHAIYRHGDRAPNYVYKHNPNQAEAWPFGLGNLSPTGMYQQMQLGKKLRKRYGHLMSPGFASDEIYVRSSDFNRTLTSAMANLVGFYAGETRRGVDYPDSASWPVGFVPVAVHSVPRDEDFVLLGLKAENCERFRKAWDLLTLTPEYTAMEEKYQEIVREAGRLTGSELLMNVRENVYQTIDNVRIDKLYGLQPTPGMTPELFNGLSDLEIETTGFEFGRHLSRRNGVDYAREMAVSLGGGLLQEIVERMQQKIECLAKHPSLRTPAESQSCTWIDRLKLYEYSAHDRSLAALFATFEFPETNWNSPGYPHYAACVLVELRRSAQTNDYFLKVLYMKEDETVDLTDDISGCEQSCSFEQFVARSQPFLLKSRDEYCASNPGSY